jgi:hypothetical protein
VREPFWGVRGVQSCMHGAWSLARGSLRCALGVIGCVRGVLVADAAAQGVACDALRGLRAHWRGMGEALGAERGCWIGVGWARCPEIGFLGIRLDWADSGDEVMVHAGRVRMAARRTPLRRPHHSGRWLRRSAPIGSGVRGLLDLHVHSCCANRRASVL